LRADCRETPSGHSAAAGDQACISIAAESHDHSGASAQLLRPRLRDGTEFVGANRLPLRRRRAQGREHRDQRQGSSEA
jgi:hypothetical protein